LLVSTVAGAVAIDFMTIWSGECHYSPQPFAAQQGSQQAVFTARIIGSRKLWGPDNPIPSPRRYWAVASVREHFWGLPWWDRRILILVMLNRGIGNPFPRGETDFIDGRRLPGSLTRFLPIFDTFCTRTDAVANAEVDLRVLREGPPRNGVRILGRTVRLTGDRWDSVPSMKVEIWGPQSNILVTSDQQGVFDVNNLPAGYYEIGRPSADGNPHLQLIKCRWKVEVGDIRDCAVGF